MQKFLRLFNFRDDDFEGAGRYLLGASYAVGRDSRAEISHTIPYNPKVDATRRRLVRRLRRATPRARSRLAENVGDGGGSSTRRWKS